MDIYHLKTFVAVARERSITRASEAVHLSQPAVSAHIKVLEDELGLALFERTPKGMTLTPAGERLLARAEQTIAAHQALLDEATLAKGTLRGTLRLGAGSSSHVALGRLLGRLAERAPEVTVTIKHGTTAETLAALRAGALDAGYVNEPGAPAADLSTVEVGRFHTCVVAPPGFSGRSKAVDWARLAEVPWVYPTSSACCGRTAEQLFSEHAFRPKRIVSVDREDVTRALVSSGVGVGLLHDVTAEAAVARKEVELLLVAPGEVRVLLACLASRAGEPLVAAVTRLCRESR